MILGIAAAVVCVLLVIALLPVRKRDDESSQWPAATASTVAPSQPINLREQQLQEEASAIAQEYRRRADEVWLAEVRTKAITLLSTSTKTDADA